MVAPPGQRGSRQRGPSAWTVLGVVLLLSGVTTLGVALWQATESPAGTASPAQAAFAPAAAPTAGPPQSRGPANQAPARPAAAADRQPGSSRGPLPNWHGQWQGESPGSRLVIGPGGVDLSQPRTEDDGKLSVWTVHCEWIAQAETSEGGCHSGYVTGSKALAAIQAEFERSVESFRLDPSDFQITDPARARQSLRSVRPGNYRVIWVWNGGDCGYHQFIIDNDTMIRVMQCKYAHEIERFSRIR